MDIVFALAIGIGLAAAAGFRVFVPLLGMSVAAQAGQLELASGFAWLANPLVTGALGIATVLEIGAYFIPWVDNALDTIATPAAVVAGTVMAASLLGDTSAFMQWGLAVIAGGGVAGAVQVSTVAARGTSAVTTAGLGNPLVSIGELAASIGTTLLALAAPLLALAFVILALVGLRRWTPRLVSRRA